MDTIATLISLNLQYGVPVDAIVKKFEHMRFEPAGMTTNQDIPFAKSFIDYVVRWMGMQFVPGYRAANAPKRESQMNTIEPSTAVTPDNSQGGGGSVREAGLGRAIVREAAAGQGGPSPSGGHSNGGNGNGGSGHGHEHGTATMTTLRAEITAVNAPADALNLAMTRLMGDAPTCTCGAITVRNGSCYKCLNCGASLGCS
jgi:ribonucleoside-diphosphate reductase alpha chain